MVRIVCMLLCLTAVCLSGCGGSDVEVGTPGAVQTPPPISVEEWKAIPDVTVKYDPETLDRLRAGDPEFESEKAWDKFMKEVVGPSMVKDKPIKKPI